MSEYLADLMEQAWSSMEEVASQLDASDWNLPTDCPEWTVKDQLAHITGIEARRLGRPDPGDPLQAAHVRNELGARNERQIENRRDATPDELLEEYRDVTSERAKFLRGLSEEGWAAEAEGPFGNGPTAEVIKVRILDVFYHDQDIRLATGRPGGMHGDVARFVFERMASAMPFVVGKRAAASDGQAVTFEIGEPGETFTIGVQDGRGGPLADQPLEPTVRLQMDCEAFLRLCGGRWDYKKLVKERRVAVAGDPDLADRILSNMAITP